jgi:uncharacterized protein YqgC (DUF456 family)
MVWLYYILLLLIAAGGLVLVTFTLPGLWVMTGASAIYALITHERHLGPKTLITLFLVSLIAEILELTLGGAAAKRAGGGRKAMVGGLVGGILGGIFLTFIPIPIISTIVGICLGSFLGAAIAELLGGQAAVHSLRVGLGAAKGRFQGILAKLALGICMFLLILIAAFP